MATRTNLATLYYRTGARAQGDQALENVVDSSQFILAHGYGSWGAHYDLAGAAAARGDADEALQYLEEAYSRGYRQLGEMPLWLAFDSLHDNAEFQAFAERIRTENAKQLESLPEAQ